ncbi:glycosyltransferase [Polynucleobacter paneuropaeus]|nr:glycosyltransferase [Polynucleobacter paneuropaeus]
MADYDLPSFVVLMAAYNGRSFIREQIYSILDQRDVSVTIYISVDRSIDGTEELLLDLAAKDQRLILLPFGATFGSAALNFYRLLQDVDFQGFDYICFADQDDIWFNEKLSRASRMLADKKIHGYSSNVIAFWDSGKERLIKKNHAQREWDFLFEAAGPGCTYVLKLELARQFQSFIKANKSFLSNVKHHDWFIYLYARANKYEWVIDEWPSMRYRQHADNELGANLGILAKVKRLRKSANGYAFDQVKACAALVYGFKRPLIIERGLYRGRLGYLWLGFMAFKCRRAFADQVMFFLLGVICWVK